MTAAIRASGLTKTYRATQALSDLDLEVETGECFGFLGPNGAGKTTTIRLLLALQRPTRGRAQVLGRDVQSDRVELYRHVGYLPGDLVLYPRMTGRHLLEWFARARGTDLRLARDLAERFQVVLDRPVKQLSTGNRQKIGLLLAFMHKPDLLILDEPTSGLDPLMQAEFEQLVRDTVAEGGTVFLSSHELDEVQRLADRVAVVKDGQLVTVDTVGALRRAAPQRVEAQFPATPDGELFAAIPGVSVTYCRDRHVALEVTGPIGPVLRAIAELDPLDVTVRHADLDELFLGFYRSRPAEPPRAG